MSADPRKGSIWGWGSAPQSEYRPRLAQVGIQWRKRDEGGQKNSVTATLTGVKQSGLNRSRWMDDTIGICSLG
jgi:hypothetical protein